MSQEPLLLVLSFPFPCIVRNEFGALRGCVMNRGAYVAFMARLLFPGCVVRSMPYTGVEG